MNSNLTELGRAGLRLLLPYLEERVSGGQSVWGTLPESVEWQSLAKAAERLGVAAPVAWNARASLSGEGRQWCLKTITDNWSRYRRSLRNLIEIARILEDCQIEAIALKGPLLALRHYDPPFLRRTSADLDLAVKPDDLGRTSAALLANGFRATSTLRITQSLHHDAAFCHRNLGRVEVHFRLSHGPLGLGVEDFLARSSEYLFPDGGRIRILDPADEIFHLVLHLVSDRFGCFFHLYELRRLWLRTPQDIQDRVIQKAIDHNFRGAFALVDLAFRQTWGEPFIRQDAELPPTWLRRRINRSLYRDYEANMLQDSERTAMSRLRGRMMDLQITDRPSDAARLLLLIFRIGVAEFLLRVRPNDS